MGYMVVFSVSRMILRKQVFSNLSTIPNYKLVAITFLKNGEIRQINKKKQLEIKVDGKMYDVVRCKDNGKSITYYCFHDHKEQHFIERTILLTDQSKSNNSVPKTTRLILEHIIKTALLYEKQDAGFSPVAILTFKRLNFTYPNPVIPVPAPPPQTLC